MTKLGHWLQASRLPSQSYIFFPLLLGEALAFCRIGTVNWAVLGLTHLFGLCIQLFIVYANDYADYAVDVLNTTYTPFSGGSRVLVDGVLTRLELGVASVTMTGCALLTGGWLHWAYQRPWALLFAAVALALLHAYSYAPFRLSYRGGGEVLQMLGVGAVLPLFGYYAQTGTLHRFAVATFWILLPTNLACAIATSLPDEPSDRRGRKRTASVWMGNRIAKMCVLGLNSFAITVLNWNLSTEFSRGLQLLALLSLVLPLLLVVMMYHKAKPGTPQMSVFVACSIFLTLGMTIWMTIFYARGHCAPF